MLVFLFENDAVARFVDAVCGDVSAHRGKRIDIGVRSYHRSRIENAVAAHLHKIAKHGSKFFATGFQSLTVYVDGYGSFVAFHV